MATEAFYKTNINQDTLIRGPARLIIAGATIPMPDNLSDVVNLTAGGATPLWAVNTTGGFSDLGSTKTGVTFETNNTEETLDVDQILGDIAVMPTNWEASAGTQLADTSLEHMALAWEGKFTAEAVSPDGPRFRMSFGQPTRYKERKLIAIHQKDNGLLRGYFFRKVTRAAQASAITHNKTGEQISIPIRFRCLPDTSIADVDERFFFVLDQVGAVV